MKVCAKNEKFHKKLVTWKMEFFECSDLFRGTLNANAKILVCVPERLRNDRLKS